MKILIDIGHPAHVHYFRNFSKIMFSKDNKVLFTCRNKDVTIELLKYYKFEYISIGNTYNKLFGKIFGLFWFTLKLLLISLKYKPDIILNATFYGAFVARIIRKPHISIEDTFNKESTRLFIPFTNVVLTGDYPHPPLGEKEIKYSGYQEIMYLHPKYYTPDISIFQFLNIKPFEKYIIIRFVGWNASHDKGQGGFSNFDKIKIVNELSSLIKVFVSAEGELPVELAVFRIKTPPHLMHDVLAYSSLYVGEGATMASECAMLGVPAIYVNSLNVHTIQDQQEKYGLIYSYRSGKGVVEKAKEILKQDIKQEFEKKSLQMLHDKIDVTAFFVWFVENYPQSFKIMKENPDYQLKFK